MRLQRIHSAKGAFTLSFDLKMSAADLAVAVIDISNKMSRTTFYTNEVGRRRWRINSFDPRPSNSYEMRGISLSQQRPDGSDEFRMDAEKARWINGHWWFENVKTRYYDANNDPSGPVESTPTLEMTMLSETPSDFLDEK